MAQKGVTDMKQLRATMQQQGVAESTTKLPTEGVTTNQEAYQRRGTKLLAALGPYREDAGPYAAPAAGSLPFMPLKARSRCPNYGEGGVVPGPRGKPWLAIVHGGEVYHGVGNAPGRAVEYLRRPAHHPVRRVALRKLPQWLLDEINDAAAEGA